MDFAELKNKSANELNSVLKEQEKKLFELRAEAHAHRLKKVHEINSVRKAIARIQTLLSTKQK